MVGGDKNDEVLISQKQVTGVAEKDIDLKGGSDKITVDGVV